MTDDSPNLGRRHFSKTFWVIIAAVGFITLVMVTLAERRRTICTFRVIDMETASIQEAIKNYRAEFDALPGSDNRTISSALRGQNPKATLFLDWSSKSLSADGDLLDPWGTPYKFYFAKGEFVIRSAGPNHRFEGSDDRDCDDYFR